MTTAVTAVVPGDVDAPTGGNVYDRRICVALAGLGVPVTVHRVDGAWPRPDADARDRLERLLAEQPDGHLVLGDGLVVCAAPGAVVPHARRLRLVALVHLPLADETGLDPDEARRLAEAEARTLAACRAVVVTGSWAAEAVGAAGMPADRVNLVEPGTDRPHLPAPAHGSQDGGRLLCLASLTPRKGQHLLVEALAGLAGPPWTCRLVGPVDRAPGYAAEVRESIHRHGLATRIEVTGPREGPGLEAVWRDTDLLVLPSFAETYGMVVAEALVRGVPVLTTSGGGAERTAAGAALLVPAGDTDALRAALVEWLGDPDLRADLRRRAATAGRGLPTWDDAARRLRDVLNDVARAPVARTV